MEEFYSVSVDLKKTRLNEYLAKHEEKIVVCMADPFS
jgi:hypothetical protein